MIMNYNLYQNGWVTAVCLILFSTSLFSQLIVECPPPLYQMSVEHSIQRIQGELGTNAVNFEGGDCIQVTPNTTYYYSTIPITVTEEDDYFFEVDGIKEDGVFTLYFDAFDLTHICYGLIAGSQPLAAQNGVDLFPDDQPTQRLYAHLSPDRTYVLMLAGATPVLNYQVVINSLGGGELSGFNASTGNFTSDIILPDLNDMILTGNLYYNWNQDGGTVPGSVSNLSGYNALLLTGLPELSSPCNDNIANVYDETIMQGDCANGQLIHHFSVTSCDAGIKDTCSQTIHVRIPNIGDIILPNKNVYLDCIDNFPVNDNNQPDPSFTGYPFILGFNQVYILDDIVNNIAPFYVDDTGGTNMVIREWTIYDWCFPAPFIKYTQYIHLNAGNEITSDCPENKSYATVENQIQQLPILAFNVEHTLSSEDKSCLTNDAGERYYTTFSFTVNIEEHHIIEVNGLSDNGILALYENAFSDTGNCPNLLQIGQGIAPGIGFFHNSGGQNNRLSFTFRPGVTYTVLVTDTDLNDIEAVIYASGGGLINGVASETAAVNMELICGDEAFLFTETPLEFKVSHDGNIIDNSISSIQLHKLQLTGVPDINTSYGTSVVIVTDTLIQNGTDGQKIIRNFNILVNENNDCNEPSQSIQCTQEITIRLPQTSDIIAPPLHTSLRCLDPSSLDEAGRPIPSEEEYPHIVTLLGKKALFPEFCQLVASYVNETVGSGLWLRHWTVLDNNTGESYNFEQEVSLSASGNFTLSCPDTRSQISVVKGIQTFNIHVSQGAQVIDFSSANCLNADLQDIYATQSTEISVEQSDFYIFEMDGLAANEFMGIYNAPVSEPAPCEHILAVAKTILPNTGYFSNSSGIQRLGVWLEAGHTYYLLAAAQNSVDISVAIHSQQGGVLSGLSVEEMPIVYDLRTWDIDHLFLDSPQIYQADNQGNALDDLISDELKTILDLTAYPEINGESGNYQVMVSDSMILSEECEDIIIERTFEVSPIPLEACEETPASFSCQQLIHFKREHVQDLFYPVITPSIPCDQQFGTNEAGLPTVSVTGYPFFISAFSQIALNGNYQGNILSNTIDSDVTTHQFNRQWSFVNSCFLLENGAFTQLVTIQNQGVPSLSCPETDHPSGIIHYAPDEADCTASINIPIPEFEEICPSFANVDVEVIRPLGNNMEDTIAFFTNAQAPVIENLLPGYYYFNYTATDAEGTVSSLKCPFIVQDVTAPVAISEDHLNISIGGNGGARIYSFDVDEGSYDTCSDVYFLIRKDSTEAWSTSVDFDCSELGQEATIYLGVWDDGNRSGEFGDTILLTYPNGYVEWVSDNFSIAQVSVVVKDLIRPYCVPPHSIHLDCTDERLNSIDTWDEAYLNNEFGTASATDNCEATAHQISVVYDLNDCGYGKITRSFGAEDSWGLVSSNTCRQVIQIDESHSFTIKFPKDETISCGGAPLNSPTVEGVGCDDFVITYEDHPGDEEGCLIERTYSVINSCAYDGESPAVIIGRDEDCDDNPGDEAVFVIVKPNTSTYPISYTTYIDMDSNPTNNNPYRRTNRCDDTLPDYPGGYWASSELNPEITSNGYFQYTQYLNLSGGQAPTISYPSAGPVLCTGNDPCEISTLPFFVVNSSCPMTSSDVHIYFDKDSDGTIDAEGIVFNPNVESTGEVDIIYNPNVQEEGAYRVTVSATDHCGNEGTFVFFTEVSNCEETHLGGNIQTVSGNVISGVPVFVTGEVSLANVTNSSGDYEFCTIPAGSSFTVTPSVELDIHDGVTTFDIMVIARHILGSEIITDPYYLIAADVNNSGSISALDIIGIQRVILGQADTFDNNSGWRAVLSDYVFGSNPLQENFPEAAIFENFDPNNSSNIDFIAIKIGDVDGSLSPFQPEGVEARTEGEPVYLQMEEQNIRKGGVVLVKIRVAEDIIGVQGTFVFDHNALAMMDEGLTDQVNIMAMEEGLLPFLWNIYQEKETDNQVIFEFKFKAKQSGRLSDFIALNSRITPAMAFDAKDRQRSLMVKFNDESLPLHDFDLLESYPNPFAESTTIRYSLKQDDVVYFSIRDMNGQVLRTESLAAQEGVSQIMLTRGDFLRAGIYIYSLTSRERRVSGRLMVVK